MFGEFSQVESQSSQGRENLKGELDNILVTTDTHYYIAVRVFEQIMSSCSTQVQYEEVVNTMRDLYYTHISERGINYGCGVRRVHVV